MVFEIDFLRKLILEREILKIQQYDIYEKCSPDVGENDGRTFRIIGTHPEELLLHIHHSMISGFNSFFSISLSKAWILRFIVFSEHSDRGNRPPKCANFRP